MQDQHVEPVFAILQMFAQLREAATGDFPVVPVCDPGADQHERKPAQLNDADGVHRTFGDHLLQELRRVMIAGNAVHRHVIIANRGLEQGVALPCTRLRDVARKQPEVGIRVAGRAVLQHGLQALPSVDPMERVISTVEYVGIRDVDEPQGILRVAAGFAGHRAGVAGGHTLLHVFATGSFANMNLQLLFLQNLEKSGSMRASILSLPERRRQYHTP